MKKILVLLLLTYSIISFAQETGKIIDNRDGKTYKTVVIGNQTWMAENLNVSRFRNGELIPEAKTDEEWAKAGEEGRPAWCYYEITSYDIKNRRSVKVKGFGKKYKKKHGKLYNWYAITDTRGLAPTGWHIPKDTEWTTLTDYLGGQENAGNKLKSKTGWSNENGTNISGFSGLPCGTREEGGYFFDFSDLANWWSCTEFDTNSVLLRTLVYDSGEVSTRYVNKGRGLSVRCIKD